MSWHDMTCDNIKPSSYSDNNTSKTRSNGADHPYLLHYFDNEWNGWMEMRKSDYYQNSKQIMIKYTHDNYHSHSDIRL